ncbi:response regulator [Pleionea sp. CnH1-48]|uniref:response regulator n=1 Tax=Pleionea sp. CnH1-48 TaxID=2954494 RepID=UPI0020970A67|nr:response regulator [Pleionea sp. CnH1-48]MCO7225884.1 response regulator [Pleionea sp. CnH1-48]
MNSHSKAVKNSVKLLLVEDNPGDIELARHAFEHTNVDIDVYVAEDGCDAVDFLRKGEVSSSIPRPDLILLDINLPKMNGFETLEKIKSNESFKSIPVVMLTSSSSVKDVKASYQRHANSYLNKPVNLSDYLGMANEVSEFWFKIARLPKSESDKGQVA